MNTVYQDCKKCGSTGKNAQEPVFKKAGQTWCDHCGTKMVKQTKRV